MGDRNVDVFEIVYAGAANSNAIARHLHQGPKRPAVPFVVPEGLQELQRVHGTLYYTAREA